MSIPRCVPVPAVTICGFHAPPTRDSVHGVSLLIGLHHEVGTNEVSLIRLGEIMEYGLTKDKGKTAEIKPTTAGKILEFMQNGHGVVNPDELSYELGIPNAKEILESLVKGGYLWKEEKH